MSSLQLDEFDRTILRDCPIQLTNDKRTQTRVEAQRMARIKRMWAAGYVGGEVLDDPPRLRVFIRDPGRVAIGRAAVETEAAGDGGATAGGTAGEG